MKTLVLGHCMQICTLFAGSPTGVHRLGLARDGAGQRWPERGLWAAGRLPRKHATCSSATDAARPVAGARHACLGPGNEHSQVWIPGRQAYANLLSVRRVKRLSFIGQEARMRFRSLRLRQLHHPLQNSQHQPRTSRKDGELHQLMCLPRVTAHSGSFHFLLSM